MDLIVHVFDGVHGHLYGLPGGIGTKLDTLCGFIERVDGAGLPRHSLFLLLWRKFERDEFRFSDNLLLRKIPHHL